MGFQRLSMATFKGIPTHKESCTTCNSLHSASHNKLSLLKAAKSKAYGTQDASNSETNTPLAREAARKAFAKSCRFIGLLR